MRVEARRNYGWNYESYEVNEFEMTIKTKKTMTQDQVTFFHSCLDNRTLWVISRILCSSVFIEFNTVLFNEKTSDISHTRF